MSNRIHYAVLDKNTLKALEQKMQVETIVLGHRCKKCGIPEVTIVLSKKKAIILKRFTGVLEFDDIRFLSSQYASLSGFKKVLNVGEFGLYGRPGRSIIKVRHL